MMRNVAILGATGSIGQSTLDVIARHPDRFRAFAVSAHSRVAELIEICRMHRPRYAVIGSQAVARALSDALARVAPGTELLQGPEALASIAAAPETDVVMAAIVGAAGLTPTLAAALGCSWCFCNKNTCGCKYCKWS